MADKPIFVTQPYLPSLDEFIPYLEKIWESKILTNSGSFHKDLEQELCNYLGVENIALFVNGTIALITSLQALRITGEVITTPYSFVATAHALSWNGIKPVFVDIDPNTFNIDPSKIESAITPQTTAIMPVHCYGYPCDVDAIQEIADVYNLQVVYDSAHAFAVKHNGESILKFGDLSVLSFHATKVFNTFEGGAIVCPNEKIKKRINYLKNFGFKDEVSVVAPGINGKMAEINAAFGLIQLKHIDAALTKRDLIAKSYLEMLGGINGISFSPCCHPGSSNNSYFPIIVEADFPISRDQLYINLKEYGIHTRRYFYPLISQFPMYRGLKSADKGNLPVANAISLKVLCLPIYPALSNRDVFKICNIIREIGENK